MREFFCLMVTGWLVLARGLGAQQELRVTQVLPDGPLVPSSTISVSFNRPVSGSLESLVDPASVVRLSPAIAVRLEWRDPATIRIIPRAPLRPGTILVVRIDTTFVASDGGRLATPFEARLEVAPPALVASLPSLAAGTASSIDPFGHISFRFSGDVDSATFARVARLEPGAPGSCTSRESFRLIPRVRAPATTDPWPLQNAGTSRDSVDQRFDRIVELRSAVRLPDECTFDLVLPQLEPDSQSETRYRVTTPPPLRVAAACWVANDCMGSMYLLVTFSAPVTYAQVKAHVRVSPTAFAGPADSSDVREQWQFRLHMRPRDSVVVSVDEKLVDIYGRSLQPPSTVTVRSGDRIPFLAVVTGLETQSRTTGPVLHLQSVNYASIEVTVTRVPDKERMDAVADPRGWLEAKPRVPRQSTTYTELLTHEPNIERRVVLPLRLPAATWQDALLVVMVKPGDLARGPDRSQLQLTADDLRMLHEQVRWIQPLVIQRTNLMAHVRSGPGGGAVFVTDVRTGRPVSGATVRPLLLSPSRNAVRMTADDGTTRLPALVGPAPENQPGGNEVDGVPLYDANPPFVRPSFVEVTRGNDRSITPVESPMRIFESGRRIPNVRWFGGPLSLHTRTAVFTDRGIYRPGEMLYFSGVVRDGWLDSLRPPAARERVRWRVYYRSVADGTPVVVREVAATLSANGTSADSVRISPRATLGTYVVRLERRQYGRWANAHESFVRVAEYRAPEFTVATSMPNRDAILGDSIHAQVKARFLFDAPMAGGAVTWRAQFSEPTQPWDVPGITGWTIGRAYDWFSPDRQPAPPVMRTGSGVLAADGTVQLTIPSDSAHFVPGASLSLDVAVSDLNEQSVSAQATLMIPGSQFFVAAKAVSDSYWWTTVDTQRVAIAAVTPQGRWLNGVRVRATVLRRYWKTVFDEASMSGHWQLQIDTVLVDSVVTRDTTAVIKLRPSAEGYYSFFLTAVDAQGRETRTTLNRYVFGGAGSVWGSDPTALPLIAANDSLKVGDVATVSFTSPFDHAEAWITVERERVLWQGRRSVEAGVNAVRIPVDASWIPNAFVGVVLVRRGDLAQKDSVQDRYRLGNLRVTVDPSPRRLNVSVSAAKPEYRPREEAELTIHVRDVSGRPVSGDVILWATDEGVLSLTAFTTPQPLDVMYPTAANDVRFSSTLQSLVRTLALGQRLGFGSAARLQEVVATAAPMVMKRGSVVTSQADAFADIRADFLTTAFYRAGIVTDANGVAKVRVRLPDNITTFRVMAIAIGSGAQMGSGDTALVVSKPLVVRASLPRFVRPADEFLAGAIVNARATPTTQPVEVAAAGEGIALTDSARKTGIASTGGQLVRFRWQARPGERAIVKLGAVAGSQQDAVQVTLPIRPDQHPRAQTVVRLVQDSATLQLSLPRGLDPVRSHLTLRVGTSPLPVLKTYAWYMGAYPYACTEQLVSSARTIIALLELQRAGQAPEVRADSLQRVLQDVADLVARRQLPDGSIGYWSSSSWSNPWLTAYAGLMLLDAQAVGVQVSTDVLKQISNFVQNVYDASPALPDTTYGTRAERVKLVAEHLGQRLAALDYLGRIGRTGAVSSLLPLANRLTWEDRARYALVLSRASKRDEGAVILRSLWAGVSLAGNRVDMPDSTLVTTGFPSRIRPAARLLEATLALSPTHPMLGALVERIVQRERAEQRWFWNTQDYASAAVAIAAYARRTSSVSTSYSIESATGRSLMRGNPVSGVTEVTMPLTGLTTSAGDSSSVPLVVRVPGGAMYLAVTADVVTAERPVSPESQGLIVERWYERFDDGKTVTEVKAGDLVRVRLRVTAPSDREFVAVEDPLPAGLEVVDVSLRTAAVSPYLTDGAVRTDAERSAQFAANQQRSSWSWWGWSWATWEASDVHDDRATFYSRMLGRGSHTVSYVARATTSGRFVKPQAHAEEMYNPALRGQSDGGWFIVRDR
ncbi:MAG: alpha-2-macroglobulin family protein [Gemmatimonadaceae bacterium]